ncbi:hypothetical protein HUT06_28245 [Actinomadura sp. NAK00032]|uniref:hypothetical protein n=1 Tax=Actinomadura sp. NAK00032 TaxID=2742128 RepID=UPI0015924E6B|nr:hypothetical protein [Actinomadura sp. NAK00032]QKW37417.1 hypothetical protein HUT06_28245 [Actinomadura sp. NAK00032]
MIARFLSVLSASIAPCSTTFSSPSLVRTTAWTACGSPPSPTPRWALDLLAPVARPELLDPRLSPDKADEPWYCGLPDKRHEKQRALIRTEFGKRLPSCPDAEGRAFVVAFLLAADHKITDPAITRRLDR